ncbi:MAG: hypothetical protein N2380_09200 [bacterium]|nr:hypothetical protein [bacterium]
MLKRPFSVYCDWGLHDELGDNIELDEKMTLEVLERLKYWKEKGVTFDYYLFDAFWFDPAGDYKQFKKTHWPNGFNRVREMIEELDMKPGLWFDVNGFTSPKNETWKDSLTSDGRSYCLFDGSYREGFFDALVYAYREWGIRMFKLDFANFRAVTPRLEGKLSEDEVYVKNTQALKEILKKFRKLCPDAVILAYNGYELIPGYIGNTSYPIVRGVDPSWLEVFDYMYSGDPRPADTPCISFRRSVDLYQDHMVYKFNYSGLPLYRIDDHGCMIGNTNTIYYLGKRSWRRSWVMTLIRGSKKAHLYGNLHLLDDSDIEFLKISKDIFFSLYEAGLETSIIGIPLRSPWHGFILGGPSKGLLAFVNSSPTPQALEVHIPGIKRVRPIFKDAGVDVEVEVSLDTLSLTLSSEQMVLLGLGEMADTEDLGECEDELVPREVRTANIEFCRISRDRIEGFWNPTDDQFLRLSVQIFDRDTALRLKAQKDESIGKEPAIQDYISVLVYQEDKEIPVYSWEPNRAVWSGCSWVNLLYDIRSLKRGIPLKIAIKFNVEQNIIPKIHSWILNY